MSVLHAIVDRRTYHELRTLRSLQDPILRPFDVRPMSRHSVCSTLGDIKLVSQRHEKELTHLRVSLDCKPIVAKVAFTPEREYRRRVIVPYLLLLGVVPYTHSDVVVASFAAGE